MSTPAGQSGVMLVNHARPEPSDRGWASWVARLPFAACITSPLYDRGTDQWTVQIALRDEPKQSYSAPTMQALIEFVARELGVGK